MGRLAQLEQVRRILCLAAGALPRPHASAQLELPLRIIPGEPPSDRDLFELSARLHDLLIELVVLIQMETAELVESPLERRGRLRLGLGSEPPLRVLDEWERASVCEESPWLQGSPALGREEAYRDALGRARFLADACGIEASRVREIVRRLYPLASRSSALDDLPGLIAGHAHRHRLGRSSNGRPAIRVDRERGRGSGTIHTPPEATAELVSVLWSAGGFATPPETCDPACGSGQFLLAVAEQAVRGRSSGAPRALLEDVEALRHLHGVDIDPVSARIAAWNLSYWAAIRAREALRASGEDLPREPAQIGRLLDQRFGSRFPYLLGSRLQVGNSLQVEPSSFSPGFIWERHYPEIFSRARPGFDLIVGNPPWVSYGLRDRAAASLEERLYYERLYPAGTQYKLTLYPIFMELALRLCREGGVHGFLVPDSILAGHHFSRIRRLLLNQSDLVELTLLEGPLWPGVHVGHTLLYAVRKKGGEGGAPVTVRNRALPVSAGRIATGPGWEARVPASTYSCHGSAPLRIFRREGEVDYLARLQATPFRIKDVAWTYSGLIARHGQRSVQSLEPSPNFRLATTDGTPVLEDRQATHRWRRALLSGSEVRPFSVQWRGGYLYWPESRDDLARIYKSGFDRSRYDGTKILLRQTGDRLIGALDAQGLLCLNNLHVIGSLDRPGIPPEILAGVLMSAPLQEAYRISSLESSRPLAQVDLKMVEDLPYPCDARGIPVGAGPLPLRSHTPVRRVLRRIERALNDLESRDLLEIAESAWSTADAPFEEGGPPGRQVLGLLLLTLVEAIERKAAESPDGSARLRGALDQVAGILFQVQELPAA